MVNGRIKIKNRLWIFQRTKTLCIQNGEFWMSVFVEETLLFIQKVLLFFFINERHQYFKGKDRQECSVTWILQNEIQFLSVVWWFGLAWILSGRPEYDW